MRCEFCDADTKVVKSRLIDGGHGVSRSRLCDGPAAHRFTTTEVQPRRSMRRVAVRRSGDRQLAEGLFDRDRLTRDVRRVVAGQLTPSELDDAVGEAVAEMEYGLPDKLQPLESAERLARAGAIGWVPDAYIAGHIERQLRKRDRVAMILYAIDVHGRIDREGRHGWQDATAVLSWLHAQFGILNSDRPVETVTKTWRHPGVPAPMPSTVIKNVSNDRTAKTMPFDRQQFIRSIARALSGREAALRRADLVAEWVLWGLAGQDRVLSSQLSTDVLDCLRRVDDIAFLRWAVHAKRLTTEHEFAAEARGLLTFPSTRLHLYPSRDAVRDGDELPAAQPEVAAPPPRLGE